MMEKTLFIINPKAGNAGSKSKLRELQELINKNPAYVSAFSTAPGHATTLAANVDSDITTIVAVGGDGTINEVVSGISNFSIKLGIIPFGSGNGLAYHLGIPNGYHEALELIEKGTTSPVDMIQVNDKLVINVGGIGFDGHVAKLFNQSKNRGLIAYMKLIITQLITFKEFHYSLTAEGEVREGKAFIIAIANGSEFGNRFKVAPRASHNDGLLNLILIRKPPLLKLIRLLISGYSGKLVQSEYYQDLLLKNATIDFYDTVAHADGEIDEKALASPLRLAVRSKALQIIC